MNTTIENFRYRQSLVKEYNNWVLLLRPKQVTIGSLILICKEEAESLSAISTKANLEFSVIVKEIECVMKRLFHFHVLPRYSNSVIFKGVSYKDFNWPKSPNLAEELEMNKEDFNELRIHLSRYFISHE